MNSQLTTFYLGKELYGIEVMRVEEVTGNLEVISVPLAPKFVRGLINLRGQIATALDLNHLFGVDTIERQEQMSVVCRIDGYLVSFLVDAIGDVVEMESTKFETPPETIPSGVKKFLKGVYKTPKELLSLLDLDALSKELLQNNTITN